jgi:CRISPR system Cascade subunit CasD
MARYLILKLEGVLQAYGGHTFEDVRPSELIPTRSALLGLLAACCGIPRTQRAELQALAESVLFSVRMDTRPLKMIDYHTVKNARDGYTGLKSHDTIQSWREYLQDAKYTVAITNTAHASISLDQLKQAIQKPYYTPYLGRRSCPITRPLYFAELDAEHALAALAYCEPKTGTIYTEENHAAFIGKPKQLLRDVPISTRKRQFATRTVTILAGDTHASE